MAGDSINLVAVKASDLTMPRLLMQRKTNESEAKKELG
jgi:hypothetical protein